MKIRKFMLVLALAVFVPITMFAAGSTHWFTYGYGRADQVAFHDELLNRLNSESKSIAEALLEADVMHDTNVSVIPSKGSTNGFETKFECSEEQHDLIRGARATKVHDAIVKRYEDLITASLSIDQVKDLTVLPIRDYIQKIRRKS